MESLFFFSISVVVVVVVVGGGGGGTTPMLSSQEGFTPVQACESALIGLVKTKLCPTCDVYGDFSSSYG